MPWFWPWRGDSSSTASFEKTLSTLSAKITDTQSELDTLRSRSRRVKVLTTLYLSFAYLVYAIVITLVVGYRNMGAYEWTGVAGGPVVIYAIRTVLAFYYNFRIDTLTNRLKGFQTERTKTIQKLKEATKYDSTLELLEKYGGPEGKPSKHKDASGDQGGNSAKTGRPSLEGGAKVGGTGTPGRTNLPPPPTANIQRRDGPISSPSTPQPGHGHSHGHPPPPMKPSTPVPVSEEFAPNAFGSTAPVTQPASHYGAMPGASNSNWYDRVLDLLLGEDETAPKNRIVLICHQCRLVNGQAPPGTKSLVEVGMWKCMACGAMNGEMDEGKKIVQEVLKARQSKTKAKDDRDSTRSDSRSRGADSKDDSSDLVEVEPQEEGDEDEVEVMEEEKPTNTVRQRKGTRKS